MTITIVYHKGPSPIGYTSNSKTDWKFVWHSTETSGMPGYNNGAYTPQLTVQLREYGSATKVKRILHQHYNYMTQAGKALVHSSGSGETNTDHAVQAEIIMTCDPKSPLRKAGTAVFVDDLTDEDYAFLAEVNDIVSGNVPIARKQLGQMKPYDASYGSTNGVRFSVNFWDKSSGHCGHQNVPGNVHGDPGNLDIQKILAGADMPLTDADVEKVWNRVGTFSDGLNPQPDGSPTVRTAQMETFIEQTFSRAYRAQQDAAACLVLLNEIMEKLGDGNADPATVAAVMEGVRNVMGPLADLRKDLTPNP